MVFDGDFKMPGYLGDRERLKEGNSLGTRQTLVVIVPNKVKLIVPKLQVRCLRVQLSIYVLKLAGPSRRPDTLSVDVSYVENRLLYPGVPQIGFALVARPVALGGLTMPQVP